MRLPKSDIDRIDDWRREQSDLPTRPEAIRRLVAVGLEFQDPELRRLIDKARFNAQIRG